MAVPAHSRAATTRAAISCHSTTTGTLELHAIRTAHVERINAAADKRRCLDAMAAMPHTLIAAGCYLASCGMIDAPCDGERFFGLAFADYADLVRGCPEIVEDGRKAIYDGRRAILPRRSVQVAA